MPQPHERTHDLDIHRDRPRTAEDILKSHRSINES
jgi:hypothetical protein